ncbi:MAG: diaminopimelate epimerase, partial [Lachnospiraceae bacterium]|nr:diaminopimelate epimerase [Lachnospiraceae bacterium]
YVYVNGFEEKIKDADKPELARKISDRHFGVGSDGLIFINPSELADFEMEMYNSDGSRGEMCGNGIRCVGKYVYDHCLTNKTAITVESFGAVKHLELDVRDGKVVKVRVDMGSPILQASLVPVDVSGLESDKADPDEPVISVPIKVDGEIYDVTCVSMGNPHAVVFVDDVANYPLESKGPVFENHAAFPARINTEFVQVISDEHVKMRVWERGSAETLACGTGCCATAVACILCGKTKNSIKVEVRGGEIFIEWDRDKDIIYMTGPAETVFEGEYLQA